MTRRKYRRRSQTPVVAVRLDLETSGFDYEKWGGTQRCKAGDWIVCNAGDTYTVDATSFARTYREVSRGLYEKHTAIWAEKADSAGSIATKEGQTRYSAGDMLVYNEQDGTDGYAMTPNKFDSLYELDES